MDTQLIQTITDTAQNQIVFVPLSMTVDNKYQAGELDQAKIDEIKQSMRDDRDNGTKGLHQVPEARLTPDGLYELAFGRHRRAAFQQLAYDDPFWSEMPLIVREFTDQQMFKTLYIENLQRREINPIEKGELYSGYMKEFNANSVQAAAFFGVSPETIRSMVRLLNLPKTLQQDIADGTLTQNSARRLLTLQRVAPDQVAEVAKELKKDTPVDADNLVAVTLKNASHAVQFYCPSWKVDAEPMAGQHLWPLRLPAEKFPKHHLVAISVSQADKIMGTHYYKDYHDSQVMQNRIDHFQADGNLETMPGYDTETELNPEHDWSRLQHLINPPACTACPFYTKVSGEHYCTFKDCFDRKVKAWQSNELDQAIKKLGIPAYDHKTDAAFVILVSYSDAHKKLVKEKSPDLRLKKANSYSDFDGVPEGYAIVAVGKTAEKIKKADESRQVNTTNTESYRKEQERLNRIREANGRAIYDFLWSVATKAFLSLYTGKEPFEFTRAQAERFVGGVPEDEPSRKAPKKERLEFYQRAILFQMLNKDLWDFKIDQKNNAVRRFAKRLQGQATAWGVKLPKNWMDQAKQADHAVTVTTETED